MQTDVLKQLSSNIILGTAYAAVRKDRVFTISSTTTHSIDVFQSSD